MPRGGRGATSAWLCLLCVGRGRALRRVTDVSDLGHEIEVSLLERSRYEPRGEVRDLQLERNCDLSTSEKPLHIDIPVKLTEEKVVFSVGALVFEGDPPASIFHLQLV